MSRHNDLTDEQELLLRDFIDNAAKLNLAIPGDMIHWAFDRMGYRLIPKGKNNVIAIDKRTEVKTIYGDPDPFKNYEDEYAADGEALRAKVAGADSSDETSTSESSESDEVGDVLQQDV